MPKSPGTGRKPPAANDVAKIITLIRSQNGPALPALFLEDIGDPRLIAEIARESGTTVGGRVYTDALSEPDGPAGTYVDLMRHNVEEFSKARVAVTSD